MVTSKINMVTNQDCYLKTLIVEYVKLKLKMSMKILASINKYFTLVIIQVSQNIMIIQTN